MGPFIRKAMQCNAFNEVRLCIGIYAMHGGVYEGKWCPFDLKSMPFTKWDCAFVNVWPPCLKGFLAIHN